MTLRDGTEWLVWFVLLGACYLMLIGSVGPWELLLGGLLAAGAAVATVLARRAGRVGVGGVGRLPAALAGWPRDVAVDCWRVAALAAAAVVSRRGGEGRLVTLRLRRGAGAGWASTVFSATPGGFVVDVASGRRATAHLLGPTGAVGRAIGTEERAEEEPG